MSRDEALPESSLMADSRKSFCSSPCEFKLRSYKRKQKKQTDELSKNVWSDTRYFSSEVYCHRTRYVHFLRVKM